MALLVLRKDMNQKQDRNRATLSEVDLYLVLLVVDLSHSGRN